MYRTNHFAAVCLAAACFLPSVFAESSSETVSGTVEMVLAADVVKITTDSGEGSAATVHTIRLVEVDAPQAPQPMAAEALALTKSLLPEGSKVSVRLYGKRDSASSFDKPIPAIVKTPDGTNVGSELILEGLAWWDWRDASLTPRDDTDNLAVMEIEARRANAGVFSHSNPIVPANFQQGARVGQCRTLKSVTVGKETLNVLQSSNCVIIAIMPNPRGADDGGESIVLGNRSQEKLSLDGWSLHDDDGGKFDLSGTIEAGSSRSIVLDEKLQLSNTGDTVWLTAPNKRIAHAAKYASARSGQFVTVP